MSLHQFLWIESNSSAVQTFLDTVARNTRTHIRMAEQKAEEDAKQDAAALAELGLDLDAHFWLPQQDAAALAELELDLDAHSWLQHHDQES